MNRHERIATGDFRAHCLALLDDIDARQRELLVTRRGKPVALIVPANDAAELPDNIDRDAPWPKDWPFPDLRHMYEYIGDVVSPIEAEWEAMR